MSKSYELSPFLTSLLPFLHDTRSSHQRSLRILLVKMTIKLDNSIDFGYDDCAEEGINLLALKMDADSSFTFGSSPSGSFSSSASSLYDPFTPNSRTSTPQQLINFDASFDGESMMFDLTPPPSATSNCFPLDFKPTVAPNMVDHNGMPSTPLRCNNIFDTTISHGNLDFTPTQNMELYNFSDSLGSSPFLVSSPSQQFNGSTTNYDLASLWGAHTDGSPITFSSPGLHLATPDSSSFHSHHGHDRRRVAMDGPQMRSAMLQQHTMDQLVEDQSHQMTEQDMEQAQARDQSAYGRRVQQTPTKSRTSKPRSATRKSGAGTPGNYRVSKVAGLDISRANKGKYKCDVPNCPKRYTRAEHLKRHKDG